MTHTGKGKKISAALTIRARRRSSDRGSDRFCLAPLGIGRIELVDRFAKLGHVLEAAIDGSKTNLGNLVQPLQLAHHQLADLAGQYFAIAGRTQLFFDALYRRIDRIG